MFKASPDFEIEEYKKKEANSKFFTSREPPPAPLKLAVKKGVNESYIFAESGFQFDGWDICPKVTNEGELLTKGFKVFIFTYN